MTWSSPERDFFVARVAAAESIWEASSRRVSSRSCSRFSARKKVARAVSIRSLG